MNLAKKNAIIYFIISSTWILLSDKILLLFFDKNNYLLQTYKGIFFVVITSIIFYILSKNNIFKIQKEKLLAEINYHKYKTLFNQLADYVIVSKIEPDGSIKEIVEINESTKDKMGKISYALLDKIILNKTIDNKITKNIEAKEILNKGFSSFDFSYQDEDELRHFEVNSSLCELDNESVIISVCRDITERTKQKKELEEVILQKDLFLREIHHRLKNTFQLIISLINLQLRTKNVEEDKAKELLQEFKSRIVSMSLVHKELYNSSNISSITFHGYVSKLVEQIKRVFPDKNIDVEIISDNLILELDQSIPCGLIINELIFNSFKYAFEKDQSGKIFISIKERGKIITIQVQDNGKGFPDDMNFEKLTSVGLRLIKELTEQLSGHITRYNDNGSCTEITFQKTVSKMI